MSGSNRTPELPDIIRAMVGSARSNMFAGWMPARVESFDAAKMKASVQLLIEEPYTDETGSGFKPVPVINEVPVMTLGDGSGIRIEVTLAKGDYVLVIFGARSVDEWLQQGGLVQPRDTRDHDVNDAICFPGLFDFSHVKKPNARIKFTNSQIQAGGSSALALVSELNALRLAFNAHVHTSASPGNPTTVPTTLVGAAYSGTGVLKGG